MRLLGLVWLVTMLLMPQGVSAQIVDNGTVTLDTSTNLEWLDVSLTVNRSFEEVNGQFGPGGAFDGWRYATAAEVSTFWTNAGIPDLTGASVPANFNPVSSLIALTGSTWNVGVYTMAKGMVSDPASAGRVRAGALFTDDDSGTASASLSSAFDVTNAFPTLGSWLVRGGDASPKPAAAPHDMLTALMGDLAALDLQKGTETSLMAKLQSAMAILIDGNDRNDGGAVGPLMAFINAVSAQQGKHLTNSQAGDLRVAAQAIVDALAA